MPPIGIHELEQRAAIARFHRGMAEARADLSIVLNTSAAALDAHDKVKVMFAQARTANRHRFDALRAQLGREVRMAQLDLDYAQAQAATDLALARLINFARGQG